MFSGISFSDGTTGFFGDGHDNMNQSLPPLNANENPPDFDPTGTLKRQT